MSYRPGERIGDHEIYDSVAEYRYYESRGYTHNPHDGSGILGNIQPEENNAEEETEDRATAAQAQEERTEEER